MKGDRKEEGDSKGEMVKGKVMLYLGKGERRYIVREKYRENKEK